MTKCIQVLQSLEEETRSPLHDQLQVLPGPGDNECMSVCVFVSVSMRHTVHLNPGFLCVICHEVTISMYVCICLERVHRCPEEVTFYSSAAEEREKNKTKLSVAMATTSTGESVAVLKYCLHGVCGGGGGFSKDGVN